MSPGSFPSFWLFGLSSSCYGLFLRRYKYIIGLELPSYVLRFNIGIVVRVGDTRRKLLLVHGVFLFLRGPKGFLVGERSSFLGKGFDFVRI